MTIQQAVNSPEIWWSTYKGEENQEEKVKAIWRHYVIIHAKCQNTRLYRAIHGSPACGSKLKWKIIHNRHGQDRRNDSQP
jgi:hypothetical protein